MKVNKFHIHWQLVRTKAKQIKSPKKKLQFVLFYLFDYPNRHNYERVMNWIKTTAMAYKGSPKVLFENATGRLERNIKNFSDTNDAPKDSFEGVSTEDLRMVLDDLEKRKYGFQFKKTPVAHTMFVNKLRKEIRNRQ